MIGGFIQPGRRARQWGGPVLLVMLAASGCQQKADGPAAGASSLASAVHTGDPGSAPQLVRGFYGIEQNAWRWTAQQFSVALHPPAGSAQAGAVLVVMLTVPDGVIGSLKTVSLSAAINGTTFPAETYSRPGPYVYKTDVPASLLANQRVQVDFQLDKSIPPTGQDIRQLGIVVGSVSLEAK